MIERTGFAVRLDWHATASDARTDAGADDDEVRHEFTQFTTSLRRALRRAASTQRYWAAGPIRPLAVTVVPIGRDAFRAHARSCGSRSCPTTARLLGMRSPDPLTAAP